MSKRIELVGGPLNGHHWDEQAHPMGPASVLKLKAPPDGPLTFDEQADPVTPVRYVTYRLAPGEGGTSVHRFRFEPSEE